MRIKVGASNKIIKQINNPNLDPASEFFNGRYGTLPYNLSYSPRYRTQSADLTLNVPCTLGAEMKLNRETFFDKISKFFGIAKEHQTNDPEFDNKFYIMTENVKFAEAYLADSHKRQALLNLYAFCLLYTSPSPRD